MVYRARLRCFLLLTLFTVTAHTAHAGLESRVLERVIGAAYRTVRPPAWFPVHSSLLRALSSPLNFVVLAECPARRPPSPCGSLTSTSQTSGWSLTGPGRDASQNSNTAETYVGYDDGCTPFGIGGGMGDTSHVVRLNWLLQWLILFMIWHMYERGGRIIRTSKTTKVFNCGSLYYVYVIAEEHIPIYA